VVELEFQGKFKRVC